MFPRPTPAAAPGRLGPAVHAGGTRACSHARRHSPASRVFIVHARRPGQPPRRRGSSAGVFCGGHPVLLSEAIAIGLVLGFFCYEWIGLSAGGFVVPGYLALYWDRPWMIATTLALAFMVYWAVEGMARIAIVYGRRRFMLSLLTGFAGQWLLEIVVRGTGMMPMEM